jgi:hypothetical protein
MPVYGAPNKNFRRKLPSNPEAEVWGPGELDFWEETRIRSKSQRTEINPITEQAMTIVDSAVFEYELFHSFLENPESGWNLFNEEGFPFERTREAIDGIFKGATGRRDRAFLILELAKEFFPEMVGITEQAQDPNQMKDGKQSQSLDPNSSTPTHTGAENGGSGAQHFAVPPMTPLSEQHGSTTTSTAEPFPVRS